LCTKQWLLLDSHLRQGRICDQSIPKLHKSLIAFLVYLVIPVNSLNSKVVSPNGWSFNPSSFPINIDRETDQCSQGKDINFLFQGFSVNGKVIYTSIFTKFFSYRI
jgi:hypothetical protein